jgi:lipid II:glycine glycyltransferase (peptidoglycan interpeptide bridge formation enzyme)
MPDGFVYLIQNVYDGRYKIGFTEASVEERRKQLLTASSQDLTVVYSFQCKHHRKIEKYLHRLFKHRHQRGEWFALTEEDVKNFIMLCEKAEKNYNFLIEQKNYFIEKPENF